jgi:hypothetical protein
VGPYTVACYYFPNYHVDPRNVKAHGPGWTEWELVKRARPRWRGHRQPRVPLWGYADEADPNVMARKIDAAADHGVDAWIFDWYHYDDGPFLQRCLDEGFMPAPNAERMRFGLMWANHDWINIHPCGLRIGRDLMYPGAVTPDTFDAITDLVVERYFAHPSYWLVEGRPYFSIYDLGKFVEGLGGLEAAHHALQAFRAKTVAAGFPGLELNVVLWSVRVLPSETSVTDPVELVRHLGFDSIGSYVWIHHVPLKEFPETSYDRVMAAAAAHWEETVARFPQPFHPNVTMGWDASPRTVQSDVYLNAGYPFMPTITGNSPARFEEALRRARAFLDRHGELPGILTLNAWNEWTEGSYLEPDAGHGMAYLEAIARVFGRT